MATEPRLKDETLSEAVARVERELRAIAAALLAPFTAAAEAFARSAGALTAAVERLLPPRVDLDAETMAAVEAAIRRHPAGRATDMDMSSDVSRVYLPTPALSWMNMDAARFPESYAPTTAGTFADLVAGPEPAGVRRAAPLREPGGYADSCTGPGCRHRCPSCRMGLVSHLSCDSMCLAHVQPIARHARGRR